MSSPLRVFLCYASQDRDIVSGLYNSLKKELWVDPWLDKAKVLPGQDWEVVIENAVDNSDVVIICLSNQSISKEGFVQREIRYAYDIALEKPEGTIFLIPLRLEDCDVPRKLRTLHWVDYFGYAKESAYSDLLISLWTRYEQKYKETPENNAIVSNEIKNRVFKPRLKIDKRLILFIGFLLFSLIFAGIGYMLNISKPIGIATNSTSLVSPTDKGISPTVFTPIELTNTPSATPDANINSTKFSEIDGMTMIYIPAGEFTMGVEEDVVFTECKRHREDCDLSWFYDAKPPHQVYLDSFWIDQTEVTNKMFSKCIADGSCQPLNRDAVLDDPMYENLPVTHTDWYNAKSYCEWAGRELPTEAQWEKAARGTDERLYPWGSYFDGRLVNFCDKSCADTERADVFFDDGASTLAQVGSFPDGKSFYGVYDLAGNVNEWVADWYDADYYETSPKANPKGPQSSQYKIIRGGGWGLDRIFVLSVVRVGLIPTRISSDTGFRCVLNTSN